MDAILQKLNRIQNTITKKVLIAVKEQGRALVKMATGTGKTEVMIKIFEKFKPKKQILICAHMVNLIDNVFERFIKYGHYDVGIYDGRDKNLDSQIVVANIMSLGRSEVLKKISKDKFDLIIMDEAHHAAASSYKRILNHFEAPVIGMTATPYRPDGLDIQEDFGPVMNFLEFTEAQDKGFLAQDQSHVILTESVFEGKITTNGDYSSKSLGKLWDTEDRHTTIIESYKKYGRRAVTKAGMKPKALCACINVAHAKKMSQLFNKAGVKSEYVVGDVVHTTVKKRRKIIETFKNSHKIEVLCVVGLLIEGDDTPDTNILLMTRPTTSAIFYSQLVGRGSRRDGGKKKFFAVLDYVDNIQKTYMPRTMGNLQQGKISRNQIITEYLKEPDSVVVEKRVENIMDSVKNFEEHMSAIINWDDMSEDELVDFIKDKTYTGYRRERAISLLKVKYKWNKKKFADYGVSVHPPKGYWTKEVVFEDAATYSQISKWMKTSSYKVAVSNGWVGEIRNTIFKTKPNGYWDIKKNVIEEAKKYQSSSEWIKHSKRSYEKAIQHKWLKDCRRHMRLRVDSKMIINLTTGKKYNHIEDAAKEIGRSVRAIQIAISENRKCGGFMWSWS